MNRFLITGADTGLGVSLVKRFLQGGFAVVAGVYRSATNLNPLAEEYGDLLALIPLDEADMDSVREAARQVAEQTGAVEIVINNAAIHLKDTRGALEELDLGHEQLQLTMNVNAFGPLRVIQQFLSLLERNSSSIFHRRPAVLPIVDARIYA